MELTYLDNNATTRVAPEVIQAMAPFWSEIYFNPSSIAGEITGANIPIEEAKKALAATLGATPKEFILTSGATESNNWVLQGMVKRALKERRKCHVVISAIEHPSVLETAQKLREENEGVQLDIVPVDENGVISLERLVALVKPDTDIVSIMLANNETGVVQPVEAAAKLAKEKNPLCVMHTDATQVVGKTEVDLEGALREVDLLSLSAHKFHGPKGVGALFIRYGMALDPHLHGGGQQNGLRAGTENPPLAAGLAKALELLGENGEIRERGKKMRGLRDLLEREVQAGLPNIRILGAGAQRLPNTSLLLFPDIEGEMLVHQMLEAGIVTSTGSACSSGGDQPSPIVTAMGVEYSKAWNVLRISLSRETTKGEIMKFAEELEAVMKTLA